MWAIVLLILLAFFGNNLDANGAPALPKTSITLNNQRGCAVHIAAWLSPSCVHCAEYFSSDIPKIAQMPGFCLDLHFMPHLYLLDMPVAILIWSQGSANAYKNAELFYQNQSDWLDKSSSREKIDDPRRATDLTNFFTEIASSSPNDLPRIKAYLAPSDPYLYVKIFALRHFGVAHLERYLPKGQVDAKLSMALLNNLPRKDDKAINFSPAFTSDSGQLMPSSQLSRGILTVEAATDLLKAAGPFVPHEMAPIPAPKLAPKTAFASRKVVDKKAAPAEAYDDDIQDADAEVVDGYDEESVEDSDPYDEPYDDNLPAPFPDEDATTQISEELSKIIDDQLGGLEDHDGHDMPVN